MIGDRIITDNIYQYGHNTPINGIDSDGEIFTMGVSARSYSFFHDIVKNAIAEANQGMLTEVHPSRNSRSRIDLVKGTEMYEVKPDKLEYRYIGLLQLLSYAIEGVDSGYRLGETALTIPQIPEIVRAHEIITITVRQDGPLIYYKVSRRLKEPKSRPSTQIATNPQIVAPAIVATAMVCAKLLLGCGGGGGKLMYCKDLNHR